MWDLIIIGGGAAGLWAAGTAAARGKSVLVLEKNPKAGVKILISGGTRCNITHNCDIRGIMSAFGTQGRFLKAALYGLPPEAVVAEFNRLGVATKIEDSGKVFPVSDRALDVRDALVRRLQDAGAELRLGTAVEDVALDAGVWRVASENAAEVSRKLLICCGGLSFSGCGTTGDGYTWARQLGHSVTATYPALTPLVSSANWVHELTGLTLPDVEARVLVGGARVKDSRAVSRGGFLWTHFGCSGPVPMNVSRWVAPLERPADGTLQLDLIPDVTEEDLSAQLTQLGSRTLMSAVCGWVPRRVAATLLQRSEIEPAATGAELSKRSRLQLIESLKRLPIPLNGTRGYAKAEVTSGGVPVSEVNPKTMQSRRVEGLYFAGEILDIDGPIGGFNFQAAFSTGHLAGQQV